MPNEIKTRYLRPKALFEVKEVKERFVTPQAIGWVIKNFGDKFIHAETHVDVHSFLRFLKHIDSYEDKKAVE